jgi:cyanophycin synthetase
MKLLDSAILRGCNVHHGSTVIRQEIDLGPLDRLSSGHAGADFAQRFLDRFAGLRRRISDSDMSAAFVDRLRSANGAPFEEVLLEAIVAVETALAFAKRDFEALRFAELERVDSSSRAFLTWECRTPKVSRTAAKVALAGCLELLPPELRGAATDDTRDFTTALAEAEARMGSKGRSTTTAVLALAAKRRGIPCEAFGGPYLRLGQGASQRLVYASVTERTSLAASQLARNKHRTNRRLAELRLPVTRQIAVGTPQQAVDAAATIGYPVVVKPIKEKQAIGVSIGVTNEDDVRKAFADARQMERRVIVESFVPGNAYRLLVIGGKFIAALQTVPATVTGDGHRTIGELVDELNADSMRDGVHLFKVPVDDELRRDLHLSGYGLDHVLAGGTTIPLRLAANVAIGGLHSDVTDVVHPDNQLLAIRAAEGIGLDIAGVDFVTPDIRRSWKETGGSIIEVNARPGLCMHTCPRHGKTRHAAGAVLELLFPPGTTGRIPVALVAGDRHAARVARALDVLLRDAGKTAALATKKRAFVAGEPAEIDAAQRSRTIPILLRDPRVEVLVATASMRRTVRRGLGLDTCEVAAVVSRRSGEVSPEAVRIIARAARGTIVVSADDESALEAVSSVETARLVLTGTSLQHPAIARHAASSGAVVLPMRERGQNWIVLYRDGSVLAAARATGRRVAVQMFALALAYGLGVSLAPAPALARVRPWPDATLKAADFAPAS